MPWAKIVGISAAAVVVLGFIGAIVSKILKDSFQTKTGCEMASEKCVEANIKPLTEKIEMVLVRLGEMERCRTVANREFSKELNQISRHMGMVEQYMKDHK